MQVMKQLRDESSKKGHAYMAINWLRTELACWSQPLVSH